MPRHTVAVLGVAMVGLLSACGSVQLPRALNRAERVELTAASIPAVVGVLPGSGEVHAETLRTLLDESSLFERVALARDLERKPDLLVGIRARCDRNPTTLVPMFTWLTLGVLPTWVHDGYGYSLTFFPPGASDRRVVIGCGPDRVTAFGWLATPLNVLPGWTVTDPVKHRRYANRLALEVARREDDLRALLEP